MGRASSFSAAWWNYSHTSIHHPCHQSLHYHIVVLVFIPSKFIVLILVINLSTIILVTSLLLILDLFLVLILTITVVIVIIPYFLLH